MHVFFIPQYTTLDQKYARFCDGYRCQLKVIPLRKMAVILLTTLSSAFSCQWHQLGRNHYSDIIMRTMGSQFSSVSIVYSTVYPGVDQRKHQSSASLAFVRGIHRWPLHSHQKGPVTRKMLPFNDVTIMIFQFHSEATTWCSQSQNDQISQSVYYPYFLFQNERMGYMAFLYWTMTVSDRHGILHALWTNAKWMPWLTPFELNVIHT